MGIPERAAANENTMTPWRTVIVSIGHPVRLINNFVSAIQNMVNRPPEPAKETPLTLNHYFGPFLMISGAYSLLLGLFIFETATAKKTNAY